MRTTTQSMEMGVTLSAKLSQDGPVMALFLCHLVIRVVILCYRDLKSVMTEEVSAVQSTVWPSIMDFTRILTTLLHVSLILTMVSLQALRNVMMAMMFQTMDVEITWWKMASIVLESPQFVPPVVEIELLQGLKCAMMATRMTTMVVTLYVKSRMDGSVISPLALRSMVTV